MVLTIPNDLPRIWAGRPKLKAVSVDLFDTLFFRTTPRPIDVFYLQHQAMAAAGLAESEADEWVAVRKDVEHGLAAKAAPGEIHLDDIYCELAARLSWSEGSAERIKALELETEGRVIKPYKHAIRAMHAFYEMGQTVIVLTDTYLPAEFIQGLLDEHLLFPFELRCSSATGEPKRSGLAFQRLVREFGKQVIHFGDNKAVDVDLARREGVSGHLICWPRQTLLEGSSQQAYALALGAHAMLTPLDDPEGRVSLRDSILPPKPPALGPELAYRWSFVLCDFLKEVRTYAEEIRATDIWFLSRDCESMWAAIEQTPGFFGDKALRYVLCSRSSCHPIMAVKDPTRLDRWGGKIRAGPITERRGEAAIAHYRAQVRSETRKVLLIDTGWKGRLQVCIAAAIPEVEFAGFYFSMEPEAEPEAKAASRLFTPWNLTVFNQVVVEALAGFTGRSCREFEIDHVGKPHAILLPDSVDKSPAAYCAVLRESLTVLLQGLGPKDGAFVEPLRLQAISDICEHPDVVVAETMAPWPIAASTDGSDAASPVNSPAPLLDRLLCRPSAANPWPRGAVWSFKNPLLVKAIYAAHDARDRLRRRAA